jgi:hypothetical protein
MQVTKGPSFGSSAIFFSKDPPLSAPFSRRSWLFLLSLFYDCISVNTIVKYKNMILHEMGWALFLRSNIDSLFAFHVCKD